MDTLVRLKNLQTFGSLRIKLAGPKEILSWSHGEITKPETINYRTLKPEKDGLFDERIFGPTKDWECYCGKYKRIRYKGVTCDKCGVEVTESRVRRERMGHIKLACPAVHVWFFKGAPSKMSLLLGLPPRALEQVVYFARYLVLKVDEKKRKEALSILVKTKDEKIKEITEIFTEKKKILKEELKDDKKEISGRLKDKDQKALALNELSLRTRKKETALSEEQKKMEDKTRELIDALIKLAKSVKRMGFLSEEEYDELSFYGAANFVEVKMGSEALVEAVKDLNLDEILQEVRTGLSESKVGSARYVKLTKRLKIVDGMRSAKVNPSWMILDVLPVLPPDLRPMVQLSGGRFATSDLNDLYRRVINRNNRLKHLITLGAPDIIMRNEKRMLQESVDSLIDTSQKKATRRGRGRQPLRSLSDMLKGKQGRFRQNLLGKRVDYSGRSVIIVGPELKLTQCGLPKEMALEMFKPFVLREMIVRGMSPNVKSAKNMLERRPDEVFDILEEITKDHPVLLNRAPTLHKLGIQAFYPVLIEGDAIRIHPAICKGFNADFDGDQMAVHIPLSKKSKKEAVDLMLADKNLLRVADGSPIASPSSKEMALGVYYLTSGDDRLEDSGLVFGDVDEAIRAYRLGKVLLRQKMGVRIKGKVLETTVGRLMFNNVLPDDYEFINKAVNSGAVQDVIDRVFSEGDRDKVVKMIDDIKDLGFKGGTISGLSFGIADAVVLPEKDKIILEADKKVGEIELNFNQGLITEEERKRLSQEVWIETTEDIADKTWEIIDPNGSIKMVIDAKVGRTSRDQIKQLAGMRGLVVDPLGKIVELPIKSNFREGLSVFEYVTSSRGSRKGLTDTALKTADAGYLTRRLVDVAHDMIVREDDCGIKIGLVVDKSKRVQVFGKRIFGRYLAESVKDKKGKLLLKKGTLVTEEMGQELSDNENVVEAVVRSPLTCGARHGICKKCYGWDLSDKKMVKTGVPVGVVAAQSIGEPGTQLTLKTKHSGGIVGLDVTQGLPRVEELFEMRTPKSLSPLSELAGKVKLEEVEAGYIVTVVSSSTKPREEREYIIPKTSKVSVETGDLVGVGTQLASGFLNIHEVLLVRGLKAAQEYLVDELQAVYESQGIPINDKHFEVIVRKMSDEVKIITSGDTAFLPGEHMDKSRFEEKNESVLAAGGEPASAMQVILGITSRSLFTESWLSAASFEQTTKILTDASLLGKKDNLVGLKENVIIGRLIPVELKNEEENEEVKVKKVKEVKEKEEIVDADSATAN